MMFLYTVLIFLKVSNVFGYFDVEQTRDLTTLFDGELYESVLDPELCALQLQQMSPLPFYDASFRVPQGFLQGNLVNYGNFDQCLGITESTESAGIVEGKMCMLSIPLDQESVINWPLNGYLSKNNYNETLANFETYEKRLNMVFKDEHVERVTADYLGNFAMRLALCLPKTCTPGQVLDSYVSNQLIDLTYSVQYCRLPNDKPWVAADYVGLAIFSFVGFATLLSTAYELYHILYLKEDTKKINKLYACGSLYSNTGKLFTFTASRPGSLTALDGVRALAIIWVVLGHTMIAITLIGFSNYTVALDWFLAPKAIWLSAGNLSVDSFFLMSGLLLVYTNCNKITQKSLLKNLHLYYLYRLLRMFPILASGVLLTAGLLHRVQDGSNWHFAAMTVQDCRQYWWSTLLHVQNYVNPNQECLQHTWYLAIDIQLHLLSPLVLFWALSEKKSYGWSGLTLALLASLTASTIFCFLIVTAPGADNWSSFYVNTLTRAPVFFLGMLYGYLLHVYRKTSIKLPVWLVLLLWVCSLSLMASMMYVSNVLRNNEGELGVYEGLIYSFQRPIWALALGWLVFACAHGYGGPINWFLSLTIWKFIARISYAMYIYHYPMQFVFIGAISNTIHFTITNLFLFFFKDLVVTIVMSVMGTVIFDTPFQTLVNLALAPKRKVPQAVDTRENRQTEEQTAKKE